MSKALEEKVGVLADALADLEDKVNKLLKDKENEVKELTNKVEPKANKSFWQFLLNRV